MFNLFRRQRARLLRVNYVQNVVGLRRNARLYLLSVVLSGLGSSVFFLFFNLYVLSLGETREFLGLMQSLPSAVALLLGIPAGLLGDRLGRRWALLIGGSAGSLALAAFLVSPTRPLMIFWTMLQGAANTLFWLNTAPFMAQNSSDEDRAFLFSTNWSLSMLASFVGSLLVGGLPAALAARMGVGPESAPAYRAAMLIGAGLSLLSLVPIWLVREVRWPGLQATRRWHVSDMLHMRAPVLKLMLPNLLIGFGAALLVPYLNLFFKEQFNVTDQLLGTIFAPRELLTAVFSMAGPALALRLGKIRSVVFAQLASLGFLLALGFVPLLPVATFAFWMRNALMNMGQPLYAAFMMESSPPEERGTVNSIVEGAWQIGWIIGPVLSAAVQARAGFSPLFVTTAVLYGLGAGLAYVFFHDAERRRGSDLPRLEEEELAV